MKKRIRIVWFITLCASIVSAVRIGYLQFVKGSELSEQAANQRWTELLETENRGNITDRHFCAMTAAGEQWLAVITPSQIQDGNALYRMLRPFCSLTASEFQQKLAGKTIFTVPLTEEPDISQTEGIEFITVNKRYDKNSPAAHLLGYCSDTIGIAGLEAAYNSILENGGGLSAGAVTDASGQTISEFSSQSNPDKERNLRLTIDSSLQNILEETGKREIPQGAAVLLDIDTSDILAMASFPDFDQSDIESSVHATDGCLVNRSLCAYDAGSVFKIIVAVAALEHQIDLEEYTCCGFTTIGDTNISCYQGTAHGTLTLQESFAKSCNCYFIELGRRLGAEIILETAEKFGVGTCYQLFENSGEQTDSAGHAGHYSDGDIANLSIGQGTVMITPLRAAEFSAIIASGGFRRTVNLVHSITDGNQKTIQKISTVKQERILSKETAQALQSMMVMTTLSGTAESLSLDNYGGAGCKTGTAQTGWSEGNFTKVHSWITGFFPAEHPKYALCVFVENGYRNDISAARIFEKMIKQISNH